MVADPGLSAAEIGCFAAIGYAGRIAVNPVVGSIVDRRGDRRRPIVALAAAAALLWTLFAGLHGVPTIFVVTLVAGGSWAECCRWATAWR